MLSAFNQLIASVLALTFLALALVGPFVALWIALSMRRDLRRIADSLEAARIVHRVSESQSLDDLTPFEEAKIRGIANSAFGR